MSKKASLLFNGQRISVMTRFDSLRVSIFQELSRPDIENINEGKIVSNMIQAFIAKRDLICLAAKSPNVTIIG